LSGSVGSPGSFAPGVGQGGIEGGWESIRRARWTALAPRYLATITLFLFFAIGVRSALFPSSPPPTQIARDATVDPSAEDFALQFARAYLTYDASHPGLYERQLAPFLPENFDSGAGFVPETGAQRVLWAEVASNQRALAGGRVITIAAQTSTRQQPVYLAVTVMHEQGRPLSLVGYPSFVGAPAVDVDSTPVDRDPVDDSVVSQVVERVVRNYLAGQAPDLKADLTGDAVVTLPTVQLRVESVDQLVWTGGPDSGAVLATVTASDSQGSTYVLTYELGIAYRERPYVDFIQVIPTDT